MIAKPTTPEQIVYPDSDGEPMAENTLQYQWIVTLRENLEDLLRDHRAVVVAADNLIYPVRGRVRIRTAPDVYVAFGRPRGHRGSYKVWEEDGIFPQVIFEILSPGNRPAEMARKLLFYERYGAEEYSIYDPDRNRTTVYIRRGDRLVELNDPNDHISPRLGIRFDTTGDVLVVYRPNGEPFRTVAEQKEIERQRIEAERQRADAADARADAEKTRADRLAAKLRELGLDPNGG